MRRELIALVLTTGMTLGLMAQEGPRFRSDDPLWADPDNLPTPMPESRRIAQLWDFIEHSFLTRVDPKQPPVPAENANSVGGVPDSSWFVNRVGRRELSLEELVRGPRISGGPDLSRPLRIVSAKTQGITPGFTVRDANGVVFFCKFDPPGNPQLATSTEVIVTNFFHAFGYRVPENYLAMISRDQLEIDPQAKLTDEEGKERAFNETDLGRILRRVHRGPDGRTPIVASRRLEGRPLGPFEYHGVRADDANDIFPHQDRRELRGMRLFAAWLNHDDSRSINSLDMYVGEPGQGHVLHHLIDFGSCLGSGSTQVQKARAGNEYIIEWGPIVRSALTLGIWDRPWRRFTYPDHPSIGRFEGDFFQPDLWRPEYPNPAFDRMLPEDAYWAARIISRFTDDMVRALVETGDLWDREAEEYLVRTLLKRRDKIVAHYLPQVCTLDEFQVSADGSSLRFTDLAARLGLRGSSPVRYTWSAWDNESATAGPVLASGDTEQDFIPIPRHGDGFLRVELELLAYSQSMRVYLRDGSQVVGIER